VKTKQKQQCKIATNQQQNDLQKQMNPKICFGLVYIREM
jgi:hypothetical protein